MKVGHYHSHRLRKTAGQTLIIAMIILGVLLILGFVFLGFIDQNLVNTGQFQKRSEASQLAEAGIRYVQGQLLTSPQGADWRGPATALTPDATNPQDTRDPDAFYLRPGSGLPYQSGDLTQIDLGGPDGLGFYTRVNFQNGRALVRVRYAPSDSNIFSPSPVGGLRTPASARNYIIVEAVGRPGLINPNDPTSAGAGPLAQITGFTSTAQVQTALNAMQQNEATFVTSRKLIAFASIGMLESGLYVTNKDRDTRPADVGMPLESTANYLGTQVSVPQVFGSSQPVFSFGTPPVLNPVAQALGGSIYSNADLLIHGNVISNLNATLGDQIAVNGTIAAASTGVNLTLSSSTYNGGAWTQANKVYSSGQLNSNVFDSDGGILRDGSTSTDINGFARGITYKDPPLIDSQNPQTGASRYLTLTRDSGTQMGASNSGAYGYGAGVYVNNLADNQLPSDSAAAQIQGGSSSLVYDWLNPDNGQNNLTGWRGSFYSPIGAYLYLQSDGFTIVRDGTDAQSAFWVNPDGTQTANPQASLRYRIGLGTDGLPHIVNGLTPGIGDINGTGLNYNLGPVFNGVLDFAGNVRVRGVIPTDVQLSVVSDGTIYVEGSIVKGVVGSDVATDVPRGHLLTRPSRSSCMLMAKQYVALNTTQFFGPATYGYTTDTAGSSNDSVSPVLLRTTGDSVHMEHEFLLNNQPNANQPGINPYNPSTWVPYDGSYFDGTGQLTTYLMLRDAMDPTSGSAAFLGLNVNTGFLTPKYLFPLNNDNAATGILGAGYVEPGYATPGYASVYGLGAQPWQRFAHFETTSIPLIDNTFTFNANSLTLTSPNTNPAGTYTIGENGLNDFDLSINALGTSPTSAYYLSRIAAVPSDVKIEASVYAQEGSFFVIPGPWFNPDPNDTRQAYNIDAANNSVAQANADRLSNFGSYPQTPFFGEPIDCQVTILGSVSENMPPPASQQSSYMEKWGWIPIAQGATGRTIPIIHQKYFANNIYASNLIISYDPTLATGRVEGFAPNNGPGTNDPYLRTDSYGRPLAPMPCLPVSPTLAYFGDEQF